MKSRLWPAVLFTLAVASLPYVAGCGDDTESSTVPISVTLGAVCDYLTCADEETVFLQCIAEAGITGLVNNTAECADDLLIAAVQCPDVRPLPESCDPLSACN